MSKINLANTDVIVLCGGLGTRLRKVIGSQPKALAPINGRPFLDILLGYLKKQGFRKIILGTGYLGDRIKAYYENKPASGLKFSQESKPLGTGGALKKALALAASDHIFVLNGDTFCSLDYENFLKFHISKKALASFVIVPKNRSDSGSVSINNQGLLISYKERLEDKNYPLMSAGIYILSKKAFKFFPDKDIFSLEYDFFPKLMTSKKCFGYLTRASAIDIGTPERYAAAQSAIAEPQMI